jgi:hypothetical protein
MEGDMTVQRSGRPRHGRGAPGFHHRLLLVMTASMLLILVSRDPSSVIVWLAFAVAVFNLVMLDRAFGKLLKS